MLELDQYRAMADAELALLWQQGRAEGWHILYERHHDRVHGYVNRKVRDPTLAEDITSEVFLRINRFIDKFNPKRGTFKGWIGTIARNFVYTTLSREKRYIPLNLDIVGSQDVHYSGIEETLREAISTLPEKKQELIIGFYYEGKSVDQIAEEHDIPVGSVKSGLYYARKQLSGNYDLRMAYLG